MTKRQVHKTYLAGVKGFIPSQWDEESKKQQNEIKERAKQICEASEISFSKKQIRVKCPLKCLSHKNGVWECHKDGKESETIFERDQLTVPVENRDVSCVLRCFPVTGRTHQIRLHLQLIGLPIANDPCYGGELHFGSKTTPLDTKDKKESLPDERNTKDGQELYQHVGENVDSFMRRICQRCQDHADITAYNEAHEHCSGIWLHALEYEIDEKKFTAPLPSWACQL
nr:RNA pseudouridylate synthase putative [Albugo laibachii Nc14]|eukprot:CCA16307.1 RNA pseudouridylate synthase putative [Albugo laibachii Nc14]